MTAKKAQTDFLDTFLGDASDEAQRVTLPTAEGFVSGFVGPVMAASRWLLWSAENLDDYADDLPTDAEYQKRGRDASWFYYFVDRDHGKKAAELLDAYNPRQVWRFELATADVLNFGSADAEDLWGDSVGGDARVTTYRSNKYRHEFHMVTLPAIVNALALRLGYIEESLFSLEKLLDPDLIVDDELQESMIGNSADNYQYSELWKQRDALWQALGETDTLTYNPIGTGSKYDTESEKLSRCLQVATVVWRKPVWARLVLVPDPRVDAVYTSQSGDVKRLNLPAIVEIYADKDAAVAAVEEIAAIETETAAASKGKAGGLELPSEWAGYPDEWRSEVAKRKKEHGGKVPARPHLLRIADELSCTVDELRAWWTEV